LRNFYVFWKNDPVRENFQNSVLIAFIVTPINVLCANSMKFGQREIDEIVRCLPDNKKKQNFASLSLSRYCAIAPNICQG